MTKRRGISVEGLAELINDDCDNHRTFWACGLIKETLALWQVPANRSLLSATAQVILNHYLSEQTA